MIGVRMPRTAVPTILSMDIPPPVIITIQLYYIALRGISKIHTIYIGYKECLYGRKPRLVQNFCRGGQLQKLFRGSKGTLYIAACSQPCHHEPGEGTGFPSFYTVSEGCDPYL